MTEVIITGTRTAVIVPYSYFKSVRVYKGRYAEYEDATILVDVTSHDIEVEPVGTCIMEFCDGLARQLDGQLFDRPEDAVKYLEMASDHATIPIYLPHKDKTFKPNVTARAHDQSECTATVACVTRNIMANTPRHCSPEIWIESTDRLDKPNTTYYSIVWKRTPQVQLAKILKNDQLDEFRQELTNFANANLEEVMSWAVPYIQSHVLYFEQPVEVHTNVSSDGTVEITLRDKIDPCQNAVLNWLVSLPEISQQQIEDYLSYASWGSNCVQYQPERNVHTVRRTSIIFKSNLTKAFNRAAREGDTQFGSMLKGACEKIPRLGEDVASLSLLI